MTTVYVIGSLRDPRVPEVARDLRLAGYDAFDAWYSAGPEADDRWRDHERWMKGSSYPEALVGYAACNVFAFDRYHLNRAHMAVLVLPAGRSCHLEAGVTSRDKPVFALCPDEIERWDVMTKYLDGVCANTAELLAALAAADPKIPSVQIAHDDAAWLAGVLDVAGPRVTATKLLVDCDYETALRIRRIVGAGTIFRDCFTCTNHPATVAELLRVLWPYLGPHRKAQLLPDYAEWLSRDGLPRNRAWWSRALHLMH